MVEYSSQRLDHNPCRARGDSHPRQLVYSEYVNNTYFQIYVNSLSPILVPIVSVGFGITSATVATLLYFTMRNIRQSEGLDEGPARRRVLAKKSVKKPQVSSSRNEKPSTGGLAVFPRPRSQTAGTSGYKRSTSQDNRDEEDGSS